MPSMVTTLHSPSSRGGHYYFPFGSVRVGRDSSRETEEGPLVGAWKSPPPAALTGIKVGTQARPHPRRLGNVELTLWAVVLLAGKHLQW